MDGPLQIGETAQVLGRAACEKLPNQPKAATQADCLRRQAGAVERSDLAFESIG